MEKAVLRTVRIFAYAENIKLKLVHIQQNSCLNLSKGYESTWSSEIPFQLQVCTSEPYVQEKGGTLEGF